MKWLIFGARGWIGQQVVSLLESNSDHSVKYAQCRADCTQEVTNEIINVQPDRVLCLIGRTHGPGYSTIDYLEQPGKLVENVRDNLFSPVSLALVCKEFGVHLTYLGTGCIFSQDPNVIADSNGYNEESLPDFFGSGYSTVKGFTDRLMHQLDVLNIRIRMPIVGYHNPRNFITKITQYTKVVNVQNSMTVLPDLLPVMIDLATKRHIGTVNLTNPGTISHNEILDLYKEHVDWGFEYSNFTIEEQNAILDSSRSNNKLNTTLLSEMYPEIPTIKDSVTALMKSWPRKES